MADIQTTLTNAVAVIDGQTGGLLGKDTPLTVKTGTRPSTALTATFVAGASLSDAVAIPDGYRIDALSVPSGWDTAGMTVQVSINGTTFTDAYEYGSELTLSPIAGKTTCLGPENSLRISKRYIKLRSGTAASPVAQVDEVAVSIWLVGM